MADGLYVLGRTAVDKKLIQQIQWMVSHTDRLYQASGLYLCSALLKFHKDQDPVYFKANPNFDELKSILRMSLMNPDADLAKHANNYHSLTGDQL